MKIFKLFFLLLLSNQVIAQYHIYSDEANLAGQKIIETSDNGFLIAATEYCYTPGAIVIEGCTYAIHLVKTNASGDTLWTNNLNYYTQVGPGPKLFENNDGSFTIITATNQSYQCNDIFVALSGFRQIEIFNISSTGELISDIRFPDNCELALKSVIRMEDNLYAVLAYYEEPILVNHIPEGRLFIMDNNANISNQITFYDETFRAGSLLKNPSNEILLFFMNDNEELQLNTYNSQLNLLSEKINSDSDYSCFSSISYTRTNLFSNNDIGVLCYEFHNDYENSHFFRFDSELVLNSENSFTLNRPTNFIERNNGNIIIASTNMDADTTTNTQINYLGADGDSLYSVIIYNAEDEYPRQIIQTSSENFALVGSVNCCNEDTLIGPSKSFLLLENQLTSNYSPINEDREISIYPNPAASSFSILIDDYNQSKEYTINIYSSLGQLIKQKALQNATNITVKDLHSGIYFYTLIEDESIIKSGKVIKNE